MSFLTISHLTFSHDGSSETLFDDVSMRIDTAWRLGLTGRNGRGKTTLLQLLMGQYEYHGTITKSVECDYFPFFVWDEARPTREIAGDIAPQAQPWQLEREFSRLEIAEEALNRPFCTLSPGQRTKILLATLFLRENRFLLIDEPTNHLDAHARRKLADYLQSKSGFILVSHDRAFLDRSVDHILAINRAGIEIQQGNFSSWFENKRRQDAYEQAENDRLQKEIGRLHHAAGQAGEWSGKTEKGKYQQDKSGFPDNLQPDRGFIGRKSAKMMKRAKNLDSRRKSAAEEKSRLMKNVEKAENLRIHPLEFHSLYLASADDLSIFYGETHACRNVRFDIRRGERLALRGGNGTGKTSILKLLTGEDMTFTGNLRRHAGLKISCVSQETSALAGSLSDYAARHGVDESLFKTILRKLDFSREHFRLDMRDFSAGQKKKTLIARSLCEPAHLYLWDEPLNFVDIFSRVQIQELLLEYPLTMVFVEHDQDFMEKVATQIVDLQSYQ